VQGVRANGHPTRRDPARRSTFRSAETTRLIIRNGRNPCTRFFTLKKEGRGLAIPSADNFGRPGTELFANVCNLAEHRIYLPDHADRHEAKSPTVAIEPIGPQSASVSGSIN
jgi:hypothetical protein